MKKLFLTSGIIACMACPAFATGFGPASGTPEGANTLENQCIDDNLGTTTGPVQLQAQWNANYHQINLNRNDTYGGDGTTAISPVHLWSVPTEEGVYRTESGTVNTNTFEISNFVAATGAITGMSAPDGITTTYTFANGFNAPHGRAATGNVTADTPTRYLTGFYANDIYNNPGTQYISVTRDSNDEITGFTLTQDGADAAELYAAGGTATEWYAHYDCAAPTITGAPTLDGYTFAGWTDESGAQITSGTSCQTLGTQQLTANWTPLNYKIKFDCNPQGTATATLNGTVDSETGYYGSIGITMDSTANIAQNCSMDGYVFQGWTCGATGSVGALSTNANETAGGPTPLTTINASNGTISTTTAYLTTAGDVVCQARWQQNTITLNWDINSTNANITATGGNTCTYDSDITVPVATRPGYTLTGWTVTAVEGSVSETPARGANTPAQP